MLLYLVMCFIPVNGPVHSVSSHIINKKKQILTKFSVLTQCGSSTEVHSLLENVDYHCT